MELIDDVLVHAYSRPIFWTFLRLLGLASSRALVRGLTLCLLHSEAPILGLLHVLLPLDPRGLAPSTRIVSPCFTRPRFQLGLSSRAPADSTKRAQSTRSIWSWLAFITMYYTLQVLQRGIPQAVNIVVLGILCSPASNSFVRSESWGRLMCLFRQTTRHHLLALNHEVVLVLHSSLH